MAVFSEFQNFNKGHAPAKQQVGVPLDLVQFLGYYEFVDRTLPVDSFQSLKEELKDAPEHVFQWSMFRTRPYIKFHLRRLFSAEEWVALRMREESYPADHQIYRHTPVDERLDSEIPKEMSIPISDSFTWREDVHGEEEAINHCLGGDALDKYVQDSEPGDKIMRSKPSGVGVTIAEDDDGPRTAVSSRDTKGTKGTIGQCLDSVLLITQAGFQRIAGRSLTSDVIAEAAAKPLEDPSLPLVHRMHAFPLGCRAMDTTNAFLRSEWISYRKKNNLPVPRCERISFNAQNPDHQKDVKNLMFRALLLRMTGRVQRFSVYQTFMREVRKIEVSQLPELESPDVEYFTSFVEAEIGDTGSSMSSWISDQHKYQIPAKLRNDVDAFISFVEKLDKRIGHRLDSLIEPPGHQTRTSRTSVLNEIIKILLECVETNAEDVAFVAQAAMLDVEELYSGIFPEPTADDTKQMIGGPGSDKGLEVIQNSGEADTREAAVELMLSELKKKSPQYLACFGAKRNPNDDVVRWIINDRPLNIYDMEHFLCKVLNPTRNGPLDTPPFVSILSDCFFTCVPPS